MWTPWRTVCAAGPICGTLLPLLHRPASPAGLPPLQLRACDLRSCHYCACCHPLPMQACPRCLSTTAPATSCPPATAPTLSPPSPSRFPTPRNTLWRRPSSPQVRTATGAASWAGPGCVRQQFVHRCWGGRLAAVCGAQAVVAASKRHWVMPGARHGVEIWSLSVPALLVFLILPACCPGSCPKPKGCCAKWLGHLTCCSFAVP